MLPIMALLQAAQPAPPVEQDTYLLTCGGMDTAEAYEQCQADQYPFPSGPEGARRWRQEILDGRLTVDVCEQSGRSEEYLKQIASRLKLDTKEEQTLFHICQVWWDGYDAGYYEEAGSD